MTPIAMSLRTVSLRHLTNGDNPRHVLGDLTELANSIRSVGVLEPVVVRPLTGGYYELLDGRRRVAAARLAGCTGISAVVRGPLDPDVAALVANGHRVGLTPVEQAEAFGRLRDRGHSQAEISRLTGYSISHVSSRLALLQLDQDTLRRIQRGALHPDRGLDAVRVHRATTKPGRPPAPPARPAPSPARYFGNQHPLADDARILCDPERGHREYGAPACGSCWEEAIRSDENLRQQGRAMRQHERT